MTHNADKGAGLCTCPEPKRPTGREPEQVPPWDCLACGGYACEYADRGQKKCPAWRCDCFIDQFPDSPRDLHPEVFYVDGTSIAPELGSDD